MTEAGDFSSRGDVLREMTVCHPRQENGKQLRRSRTGGTGLSTATVKESEKFWVFLFLVFLVCVCSFHLLAGHRITNVTKKTEEPLLKTVLLRTARSSVRTNGEGRWGEATREIYT